MSITTSGNGQASGPMTHAFGSPLTSGLDVDPNICTSCQSSSGHVVKKAKGRSKSRSVHSARGKELNNVRLRNSCRSCANLKVKCDKGKPTCSRCQLRSLDCEYLQSKRPGRVPGKSQISQPANHFGMEDTQCALSTNYYTASAGLPSAVDFGLGDYGTDFGRQKTDFDRRSTDSGFGIPSTGNMDFNVFGMQTSDDTNTNCFYGGNAPTAPMGSSGEASSLEGMVGSDWTMSELNLGDLNSWWIDSINYFSNESLTLTNSNHIPLAASTEPSSLAPSSSSPTVYLENLLEPIAASQPSAHDRKQLQSPVQSQLPSPGTAASNPRSSCTCMVQALDLLKALPTTHLPELPTPSVDSYTQRVLLQNKQDIEVNLAILECRTCVNDRYLLMILLMIAAKILTRYVSVAASCGSRGHGSEPPCVMQGEEEVTSEYGDRLMEMSQTWGGFRMMLPAARGNGSAKYPSREAVQRVLRELHRVQRLLSSLALRRRSLGGYAASMCSVANLGETSTSKVKRNSSSTRFEPKRLLPSDSTTGSTTAIPMPFVALESVEADIRHGLSALSAVMRSLLSNS
ncbi:hypothetical protein LTR17_018085 [Elasticomyces elasticus]|nr:hypothetical protein LTR17_018085 [Elasticomyces elasticus]